MRIACVADTHADDHSRFDEHEKVMDWIANDIVRRKVDLVVHAGDAFERSSTTAEERAAVGSWVRRVADHCPIVIVAGNHDNPRDIAWLGNLRTKHPVTALDRPGVVDAGGVVVVGLPWPRRANILAECASTEVTNLAAQDALRNVLRGLNAWAEALARHAMDAKPVVFVGHVDLVGAMTDQDQPMVGGDMSLTLADLALVNADAYVLGHIHKAQEFHIGDSPCAYPGAPRHNNFGEAKLGKGYMILEPAVVGDWTSWSFSRVSTPCRPMVLIEAEWVPDAGPMVLIEAGQPIPADAEIRLRYRVVAEQRAQARSEGESLARSLVDGGAHSVKIEEQVKTTSKARAPELARVVTVDGLLERYLELRGIDPRGRKDELVRKLKGLEGRVP